MQGAVSLEVIPLIFLLKLAFFVSLFYLACLISSTPLPPFFKTAGLVALSLVITTVIFGVTLLGFYVVLEVFYHVEVTIPKLTGGIGAMFVNMLIAMFGFSVFVVVGGLIYNWGLKIDNGQSIATVQAGIPTAFCVMVLMVGVLGRLTGIVSEPQEADPTQVAQADFSSFPTPAEAATTDQQQQAAEPAAQPEDGAFTPASAAVAASMPSDAEALTEDQNSSLLLPASPSGVKAQPPRGSVLPPTETRAFTELFSTPPAWPNPVGERPSDSTEAESVPFSTPEPESLFVPATRPIPVGLLSRADWALEHGQIYAALQHLYAAAVAEDAPLVWQNVAWSETFNRPLFSVMWGVGVEGAIPTYSNPNLATAGILAAVYDQLQGLARRSVFSKHAEQLVHDAGVAADRRKLVASAREAGLDALAVVSLQRVSGGAGRTSETMLYVYLLDVATGRTLWRSDGLTRTRYLRFREQGHDLGVELAAEAGQEASRLSALTSTCPLKESDARARIREWIDARPNNPLHALFVLNYLHRQQKISDSDKALMLEDLVGQEAAAVLAGNDADAKGQQVANWLPQLRPAAVPRPSFRNNRPFAGFSGEQSDIPSEESVPEERPAEPEAESLPRRPATSGAGGARSCID